MSSILTGLSAALLGSTEHPCPSPPSSPEAAENALWTCANDATNLALFALVFTLVALLGSYIFALALHYWVRR